MSLPRIALSLARRHASSHAAPGGAASVGIVRPRHPATPIQSMAGRPADERTLMEPRARGFENQASVFGYTIFTLLGTYFTVVLLGLDDQNASPLTRITPDLDEESESCELLLLCLLLVLSDRHGQLTEEVDVSWTWRSGGTLVKCTCMQQRKASCRFYAP